MTPRSPKADGKYPDWVCEDCALAAGGSMPMGHLATYHHDICGVCKRRKGVTQPRDYGYPNFKERTP